jgi:hypothetical protein
VSRTFSIRPPPNRTCKFPTKPSLDTPLNNPPEAPSEEVEVTDPTHPLFGRRFAVLSVTRNPRGPAFVFVAYRDAMRLRILVSSTDLAPSQARTLRTKWTREAIQELLSLVAEGDTSCHKPGSSGEDSRNP